MSLKILYRKLTNKPLGVYWWRYEYPDKLNFGDELTPILIERLFNIKTAWKEPNNCEVIGAGSIIEVVDELSNGHKLSVWGSGFIKPGGKYSGSNMTFHAVRGMETLSRIQGENVALGDPGLLTSLAFEEIDVSVKKYRVGVIPHYIDSDSPTLNDLRNDSSVVVIDALWPVQKVVETIASCELVLSSSLHGLIISDSFGIPNYWVPLSDNLTGGDYKFKDYYSVFDETPQPLGKSVLSNIPVDDLISQYTKKTNLKSIQKDLLDSFPF